MWKKIIRSVEIIFILAIFCCAFLLIYLKGDSDGYERGYKECKSIECSNSK